MLLAFWYNYLTVCLISHFIDPVSFQCPQLALLLSQISLTWMLEDSQTYVPQVVRSVLAFWYVFMQLAYPVPVFAGMCIGLAQGLLAQSTPSLIGFDLFFPP